MEDRVIDQVGYILDKLTDTGYTRRAQAITWNPRLDPPTHDPPCLQRLWARLCPDEKGGLVLNLNTHWRSRDLFKAWFENVIALTTLMRKMAEELESRLNKKVHPGRYLDISDSLHIYGSYFREIQGDPEKGIKSFFEKCRQRPFEERTWSSDFVKPFFLDDGLGKGLRPMLKREESMPQGVRRAVEKELRQMEDPGYVV
jgi:hypothetical protein